MLFSWALLVREEGCKDLVILVCALFAFWQGQKNGSEGSEKSATRCPFDRGGGSMPMETTHFKKGLP